MKYGRTNIMPSVIFKNKYIIYNLFCRTLCVHCVCHVPTYCDVAAAVAVDDSIVHNIVLLGFLPVQLVVLLHRRNGVHRAEQYLGGDLDAPGWRGRPVAGTAAATGRWRPVSAARAVQTLCRAVVVHVATRRPGRRTVRHSGLGRTFWYLQKTEKMKEKKGVLLH